MKEILVLYYSRTGAVARLAEYIAAAVNAVEGVSARIRTVPPVTADIAGNVQAVPNDGPLFCELDDLRNCDGLILGSPTRFGNMAAPLKHFIDSTSALWASGSLIGKPASVFTSSSSMHGGNESTLLSMILPLLHHGMLIQGLPYSEAALHSTTSGGTPYGASHVSHGNGQDVQISDHEQELAKATGRRMAQLVKNLKAE